jgi:succinyl-CoA synthetase beta subunit
MNQPILSHSGHASDRNLGLMMNPSGLASSRMDLVQVKNGAAAGVSTIHDIVSGI